jgi:hypothetical protein
MRWTAALLLVLAGCEPVADDVGTTIDLGRRPDITGTYTVAVLDRSGCPDHPAARLESLEDGLVVSGPADDLTFTFGSIVLAGEVDTAFSFEATGTTTVGDDELDIGIEGLAFIGDESWNLDGDLLVDRIDSTAQTVTCTLTALLEAEQTL